MKMLLAVLTLLAVACSPRGGGEKGSNRAALEEVSQRTGLTFHHFTGATGDYYLHEITGSGVALFDFDADGDLDVFFPQGDFIERNVPPSKASYPLPAGFKPGSRLFRNELAQQGVLRFTDVTEKSRIRFDGFAMGTAVGDYDNNGTLDLYVTGYERAALFRNNGDGAFEDVTAHAGVHDDMWGASAAFVDYDRDGKLDLFVTHYVDGTRGEKRKCRGPLGGVDFCSPSVYRPTVDRLWHNEGGGKFKDVTAQSGIGSLAGPGLGVVCADFDGDGWIDLYVANDGAASFLWLNQRDGTFREAGLESGVAYNSDGKAQAGMGVAAGDFDNDGDEDIFKSNQLRERFNLYRNNGKGSFVDVIGETGLAPLTFLSTGFGAGWVDYDNDGWLDLFVANGGVMAEESQLGAGYPYAQPNLALYNEPLRDGRGRGFRALTGASGTLFPSEVSRGAAFGDVDNDGDLDVVVSNSNGPARLYLSTAASIGHHWLNVRLRASRGDPYALHALVIAELGTGGSLVRRVHADGSYLSASDPAAHFGLGEHSRLRSIRVRWPDGSEERWDAPPVDRLVTLKQGTGR